MDEVEDYELFSESCEDIAITRPFINPIDYKDLYLSQEKIHLENA